MAGIKQNTLDLQEILETVHTLAEAGIPVKTKSGTFTTGTNGKATVDCGFQPDCVYIKGDTENEDDGTFDYSMAMCFDADSRSNQKDTLMWAADGMVDAVWTRSSTGFAVSMYLLAWDYTETAASGKTYSYIAVKYTA